MDLLTRKLELENKTLHSTLSLRDREIQRLTNDLVDKNSLVFKLRSEIDSMEKEVISKAKQQTVWNSNNSSNRPSTSKGRLDCSQNQQDIHINVKIENQAALFNPVFGINESKAMKQQSSFLAAANNSELAQVYEFKLNELLHENKRLIAIIEAGGITGIKHQRYLSHNSNLGSDHPEEDSKIIGYSLKDQILKGNDLFSDIMRRDQSPGRLLNDLKQKNKKNLQILIEEEAPFKNSDFDVKKGNKNPTYSSIEEIPRPETHEPNSVKISRIKMKVAKMKIQIERLNPILQEVGVENSKLQNSVANSFTQ